MKKFSDRDIVKFCEITEDPNNIHNPEWMKERERYAIVPGMYSASWTLSESGLLETAKAIDITFGNPSFSGDSLDTLVEAVEENQAHRRVGAIRSGEDLFSNRKKDSYVSAEADLNLSTEFTSSNREYEVTESQLESFAELIGADRSKETDFLTIPGESIFDAHGGSIFYATLQRWTSVSGCDFNNKKYTKSIQPAESLRKNKLAISSATADEPCNILKY